MCVSKTLLQSVFLYCFQAPFNQVVYELAGDALALEYFIVTPKGGQIYQRRAVQYDSASRYEVSPHMEEIIAKEQHVMGFGEGNVAL